MPQLQKSSTVMIALMASAVWSLATTPARAQSSTSGQITGTVKDQTGAVLAGVSVAARDASAGIRREARTNAAGIFSVPFLPPGDYEVSFDHPGFASVVRSGVLVKITMSTVADATLRVAGDETLTVTAEASLLQADRATTGRVIEERTIRQLPLATRNFQQLLGLSTGTIASVVRTTDVGRGDAVIQVNGQRQTNNNLQIDGVDANSVALHSSGNLPVPSTEALQEFIVQTSLYDASRGRNSGGLISAVTKSGTNQIHGSAYEFFRNKALNANDFFLERSGQPQPDLSRNAFGATLGGPLQKDKTFFFLSYHGTREKNGASLFNSLTSLVLPSALTDDRSAAALATVGNTVLPAGAARLTAASINSVTLALMNARLPDGRFVLPTPGGGSGPFSTVALSGLSEFEENQFNVNLDHRYGGANTLGVKFFFNKDRTDEAITNLIVQPASNALGWGGPLKRRNSVTSVHDTHVFSPSVVNEARLGYAQIDLESSHAEPLSAAAIGMNTPLQSQFPGMPQITVPGLFTVGPEGLYDQNSTQRHFTFSDTLTVVRGGHSLRAGVEARHYRVRYHFNAWSRGFVQFQNFQDFLTGDFFLSFRGSGDPDRQVSFTDYAGFVQDDIKVNSHLTLNLGLRYEFLGNPVEKDGKLFGFDTAAYRVGPPPNGFVQAGNAASPLPGVPLVRDTIIAPDRNNFAPRIGFAWTAHPRLVVRGGYGMYYIRTSAQIGGGIDLLTFPVFALPLGLGSAAFTSAGLPLPVARALGLPFSRPFVPLPDQSAFPLTPSIPSPMRDQLGQPVPLAGVYMSPEMQTPYSHQFGGNVQVDIGKGLLLEVGYLGARGRHLAQLYNLNQPVFDQATGRFSAPYSPAFSSSGLIAAGLHQIQTTGRSQYDSLQVSLAKRPARGLNFLAAYTLSESKDSNSGPLTGDLAALPGDQQNYDLSWGPSDWDRRHRFVLSAVWDVPDSYQGNSGLVKGLLNDWQVAGVAVVQSGTPFSIICACGGGGTNSTRANFAPGFSGSPEGSGPDEERLDRYFNTSAFVPPVGTFFDPNAPFGNTGRNIVRGPGQRNIDLSLIKLIPVSGRTRLELRGEFFNLLNTTNFANPESSVLSPAFGRISRSSTGPRVVQFAVKLVF